MKTIEVKTLKETVNEAEYEGPYTPCVYFLDLPLGDVLKVGITTINGLFNRRDEAQRYFVDDVKYIGLIYCHDREHARSIETYIKNTFGTSRSVRNDLVPDTCEVRKFIEIYFIDADFDLEISENRKREKDRERR